jgi:exodeoxyribonuclease VII small subunit
MNEHTFESALARLNEIIALLEKNEVSLSQAATLYQEGQTLLQFAQTQLTQFESLIETKGE